MKITLKTQMKCMIALAVVFIMCAGIVEYATYDRGEAMAGGLTVAELHEVVCGDELYWIPIPNEVPVAGLDYYVQGYCNSLKIGVNTDF